MKAHLDFQTEKVESDEEERLELLRSGPSDQRWGFPPGRGGWPSSARSVRAPERIPPSLLHL